MGGEVQVSSKLGEGTTFSIIITTKSRVEKSNDDDKNSRAGSKRNNQDSSNYLSAQYQPS